MSRVPVWAQARCCGQLAAAVRNYLCPHSRVFLSEVEGQERTCWEIANGELCAKFKD